MYITKITVIVETSTYEENEVFEIKTENRLNATDISCLFEDITDTIDNFKLNF